MANSKKYEKIKAWIRKWEGKNFVNDPDDTPTKWGVTIATYRQAFGKDKTIEDLKNMSEDEWDTIFKKFYWNKMKCDKIKNWSICQLCVSMCWGSGSSTAIKKIQSCIGCKLIDGIVGEKETLRLLNGPNPEYIFQRLWQMRYLWFQNIVLAKPVKKKYLRGWLNKLADQKYDPMSD